MRILLVGEFSGFHRELRRGLISIGHEVSLVSAGDGWKGIEADISIPKGNNGLGRLIAGVRQIRMVSGLRDFDVVQFIFPHIFNRALNLFLIKRLIENNRRSFLLAAGSDAYYADARHLMRYHPYDESQAIDKAGGANSGSDRLFRQWNEEIAHKVDGIVPIAFEYRLGYEGFPNLRRTVPIPFSVSSVVPRFYSPNKGKIRIFHGISRRGFKGTRFILAAFDRLKVKYGDRVQIETPERLPYEEYIKMIGASDIVVDQCLSYSYGVNAVLSLALGKVTLSGCEPECLLQLGVADGPVINIKPSADDIFSKLCALIDDENLMVKISRDSRCFFEQHHDSRKVAQEFCLQWGL